MKKDTLRVLVGLSCNMDCAYCCNKQERTWAQIRSVSLDEIDWAAYQVFCITGGEPLLYPDRIRLVCDRVPRGRLIVLYTNGTMLSRKMADELAGWGVRAINVGLHEPATFGALIENTRLSTLGLNLNVRFYVRDRHSSLAARYPDALFRFWKLDDCDRANEDRVFISRWGSVA